jgi:hypothetical protein
MVHSSCQCYSLFDCGAVGAHLDMFKHLVLPSPSSLTIVAPSHKVIFFGQHIVMNMTLNQHIVINFLEFFSRYYINELEFFT